ncbi:MAG: DUF1841 family protein [Pseudomonadota bacterium]|uniref:DUF1841 family protein n=1 Tax=Thermithiobacillus tepidarius TaxID=929 RepID=UPI0004043D7B|nr:DUF1841 family protein [Thermithiobacillus tepidarius]
MLYGDKRETYREVFFQTWRKYQEQRPLEGIEKLLLPIMTMHPEYHELLAHPERAADRDYPPEMGQTNPFLHMGLHVSIAEQVSIDQPPGIKALYEQACRHFGDVHAAEHAIMECLAETLWQMQRSGSSLDMQGYLNCIRSQSGLPPVHS